MELPPEVALGAFVRTVFPDLNDQIATGLYHLAMGRKIEWQGQDVNLQGAGNSRVLAKILAEKTGKPFLGDFEVNKALLATKLFSLIESEYGPPGWLVRSKKPTDPPIIPDPNKDWTKPPAGFLLPGPDDQVYRNPARTEQEVEAWKKQRASFQDAKMKAYEAHRAKGGYSADHFWSTLRPNRELLVDLAKRIVAAGVHLEDYVNVGEAVKGSYPFAG